jgi:hypothetical protein
MGSRVFFNNPLSFAAGFIKHQQSAFHLPGEFPGVYVAKGPGDSGVSSAFLKFSTNQSEPLHDVRTFRSGFLTSNQEG